jgi:dephospho-CoA kinase
MIIGITGTNGAGKGTVVDFLTKQKGFNHFSVRNFLTEEIKRRGFPIDRPHMRLVGNEMRQEHGPGYIAQQLMEQALAESTNSVIESIRSIGEAEYLKAHGALLWAVDADRGVRYERILKRWSETDRVSFEQFCEYEDQEMRGIESWDMNVFGVMKMADHIFANDGTPEEFFGQVEEALKNLEI